MVTSTEHFIDEDDHAFLQLEEELKTVESVTKFGAAIDRILKKPISIDKLANYKQQKIKFTVGNDEIQIKALCLNGMQHLQQRIIREGADAVVQRILSLSQSIKDLERQESVLKLDSNGICSKLQAEVNELENMISCSNYDDNLSDGFDHSLHNFLERLNSGKRELAVKLREIVSLKRQLDDVPVQAELIQYEHRFSELYVHIQVTSTEHFIDEDDHAFLQLEEELKTVESSVTMLTSNLELLNQRKALCLNEMQYLQQRIMREGADAVVQRILSLSQSLKDLERQESVLKLDSNGICSKLQAEVNELENMISCGNYDDNLSDGFDHSLHNFLERLNSGKRELAVKLREIVSLKRQIDDVPVQAELIQYEHRFSELYVHIQEKLQKTRKLYATYNALLEIKDLMLKETSLLNSIDSQFQAAITSTAGRMKLIDSMEGIMKGIQQKLKKVALTVQAEQKNCDAVKKRYAAVIAEQRSCYSLLKDLQEECTKNERLRSQSSKLVPS